MPETHAIIMAGGSGTRFWPASRRALPKQLLPIAPGSRETLIANAVRRIEPLCPPDRTLIATGAHLLEAAQRALPSLPPRSFLGEPVARNTAACIGWAASIIGRSDPNGVVMVLPSDHHIADEPAFQEALRVALSSASQGPITTLGIRPTRPETGYGYIELAEEVSSGVHQVARFVEKPDRTTAQKYVTSGRYLWNAGMFFFRVSVMMRAIEEHMPALAAGLRRITEAAELDPEREREVTATVFESLEPISIDYGVMEKSSPLHVVPATCGWSDLGSWQSAWELSEKDDRGNAFDPGTLGIDARGNLVRDLRSDGRERLVALVGVENLCVVETEDALLVIPRDRAQDVRKVVKTLRDRGDTTKL